MNEIEKWHANSSQYLAAALAWLRLRLMRLAQSAPQLQPDKAAKEERRSCWFFSRKKPQEASSPVPDKVNDETIAEALRAMTEAAQVEPPPPFVILSRRFGLSPFEMEILLLCAAMELDTRIPALCARAQYPAEKAYPTFALAFTLFNDPAWDAISAERPLRYWRLIEIHQPATTPLTQSALRADERVVNYIKGLNQLDDRLIPFLAPFEVYDDKEARLAASHQNIAKALENSIRSMATDGRPPVIQLTGIDPVSKQQVVLEVLSRLGLQGYRMPGELLSSQPAEIESLARLWHRESVLLPLALYIEPHDIQESGQPVDHLQLNRFLARCGTLTFLDTREPRTGVGLNAPAYEVDKPLVVEQQAAWQKALGSEAGGAPEQVAAQFNLNLPAIRQIARFVLAESHADESLLSLSERTWQACLSRTRPRLDRLAQRIEPKADWEALILPDETLNLLHAITDQVKQRAKVYDEWGFRRKMSRGFGISALFAGESGTGKTMAAEVIANDLRLDLYRIDLSAVVSKYIGETEKNLRRVFDAAENGGVILFFDEADALFGKRSEVKDSHDRYANIEVNYLLQRMEAFRGLAILATNMKSALDPAFMRRIRFIVTLPFPGAAERKRIWERVYPKDDEERNLTGTPVKDLDYDHLTRFNLTGGSIHNVALNAAFLAARDETPVTMPLLFDAARAEFRKLEKPVNEGDFRLLKPVGEKA